MKTNKLMTAAITLALSAACAVTAFAAEDTAKAAAEDITMRVRITGHEKGTIYNHEPLRNRRLLLHKRELNKLFNKVTKEGYTLVPTKVYLKKGRCKVEIALAKGKKLYDKREVIKKRENDIYIAKALKRD